VSLAVTDATRARGIGKIWRASSAGVNQATVVTVIIAVILVVLVAPPVWFLIKGSFTGKAIGGEEQFTLDYYRQLLQERRLFESVTNVLVFAVGSAVVALLFGGLLAWIVERTDTPLKALAYLTSIISLGTPYVLYVSAWLLLLGRAGPVNMLYQHFSGESDVLIDVYSLPGMILVEGFLWSPLVFLLLGATLRNGNPELEEAARMSGASVWDTFWRITLRLSMPAVLALAMLVFIRSLEAFEVPALVGLPGSVNVLTTDIYIEMHDQVPPDFGRASAFSVVLLMIVAVLLYVYGRLSRRAERFATITGKGYRPRLFALGRVRYVTVAVIVFNFLVVLVAPLAILIWAALMPFYQSPTRSGLALLTLDNFRAVLQSLHYLELMTNTVIVAASAATAAVVVTMFASWCAARRKPGGWILDQLATIPLIFPGIVLGVAVMQVFLNVPVPIYGTLWILVWALTIRYLPYGMRYSYAGMLQIHGELEEAASVAGATSIESLRRIIMPLLAPSLIAGWLFIFLLAARVLSLPILLAGPGSQTVAVAMYDLWANGQGSELAALGILWTVLMTAIAFSFYLLARRTAVGPDGR
jgi:iron(III) transport system permease protein